MTQYAVLFSESIPQLFKVDRKSEIERRATNYINGGVWVKSLAVVRTKKGP